MRQNLVVVAMTGFAFRSSFKPRSGRFSKKISDKNLDNLRLAFSELTKKERMAVMCTEVKYEGKAFPLLPLLFLNYRGISPLVGIIKDFVPEVFSIRFQINGEEKDCDIIGLLEKMNNPDTKKWMGKSTMETKKKVYRAVNSLDRSIGELTKAKEDLISCNSEIQTSQTSQALKISPSTLIKKTEEEVIRQIPQYTVVL